MVELSAHIEAAGATLLVNMGWLRWESIVALAVQHRLQPVLFCFVLLQSGTGNQHVWPRGPCPGRRRRAAGHHRTHWHGGSLCGGYSQFGYQRLLPARTAQSAPFRWPTVDHCALQALPGSPEGRTGTARAMPVPARWAPAPVARPPVTAAGMRTLLCPSAGSSPGLPHW